MGFRHGFAAVFAVLALGSPCFAPGAQPAPQTAVNLSPSLLPEGFGDWHTSPAPGTGIAQPRFLAEANQAALQEAQPERSVVHTYTRAGANASPMQVTAIEFKDASGALSAFTVLEQPGMQEVKGLGRRAALGNDAVLFTTGASLAVAYPATATDVPALKALADTMPKPVGSKAMQPLLPTLLPTRGLQPASQRYALGPRSYMAEGGVLPANGLGWQQSAEAISGKYVDKRGAETLTLLLYPTPTIAGAHLRAVDNQLAGLGPSFAKAKTRRDGSLLILANGSFSPDAAQALVENIHLRQLVSTDKAMPTPDVIETRKTFGLLANVIIFSGVLGIAALGVGLFLGGGRALVRILQGKPPATEAEFLSLHLDSQNQAPRFGAE